MYMDHMEEKMTSKKSAQILTTIQGTALPLPGEDIDTDQIIPARFMRVVTFEGIEQYAFYDLRYDSDGKKKDHPFNDSKYSKASILLVGNNFGCGSSREHAPQTIMRSGIKAIIGLSFAEIFAGNCNALGLPVLTTTPAIIASLMETVQLNPSTIFNIDIEQSTLSIKHLDTIALSIPRTMRATFLTGTWDSTITLLKNKDHIAETYQRIPYISRFTQSLH